MIFKFCDTNVNILTYLTLSMKKETKWIIQKYKKIWNDMYVKEHRKIL